MKKLKILIVAAIVLLVAFGTKCYADNREKEVHNVCEVVGAKYGISPELLQAIAYTESRYQTNAQNGECKGICQVNLRLHADRLIKLGISDPLTDYSQITLCADIITDLRKNGKYGNEVSWVLDRYNGLLKADMYCDQGIMSDYATKVLNKARELEIQYGKGNQ